ncbi:LysR family transcriptional regulator [Patulibacter sp. NPDC049589]|uniref:LysR family transcriptional regulator n=1 Tax=Patulibacter sp. NPDC049589 TaxID=3154731 RepID=UPI0034145B09
MADLDIIHLRTFVAIAECGGFGRAAVTLHMSQPTVSQHVRGLEKRLGQPLVERAGRATKFTAAGEKLLLEARRILGVHDQALERLDVTKPRAIVVGSTETAADQILPELLTSIRAAYPDHGVQFHIDRSTQMEEGVDRGTIDLAVTLGLGPDLPGSEIGALPLNWYAAPGWEAPDAGEPWPLVAYVEPCGMRQRAFDELGGHGHHVEVVAESTSLEGVIAAARAGLGVAVLPTAGSVPSGLAVRRDLPDLGQISLRLLTRKGLDPEIGRTAFDALLEFYAVKRYLHPVASAPRSIGVADGFPLGNVVGLSH